MIPKVSLDEKIREITEPWSPVEIARVNDYVVRMALFEGEYHWHKHTNEDELFYVYRGRIVIQLRGQPDITLEEGEMAVVAKGVEHCPKALEPSYVLMFEPAELKSRGD
ncbi:mannose-6-phosphate isomerase [Thermococcus pacificus]|uniref:Mannose-6-phosphate isomerase n=1 Tax=Thermococcus pacificus TaxID=71998 RepID=A0A218P8U8_9EURY|nr:mannose-6-phosphate isomerase [Thermococcus pacificus]